jgi:carbon storage regulator
MLCLRVKINESIMITDVIEVVVLSTQGGTVRLGIKAPRQIPVHRKVVWNRIQAEKQA